MSDYDINRINVDYLKQYYSSFISEKNFFFHNTSSTLFGSYLVNCPSDPVMDAIKNLLLITYNGLENAYDSISDWWSSYIDMVGALEKKLISKINNNDDKINSEEVIDEESPEYGANLLVDSVFEDNHINLYHWLAKTGTSNEMINYVIGAINSAIKNENPLAVLVMNNLYKIEQKINQNLGSDFYFIKIPEESYCERNYIAIDETTVSCNNYSVFFHEIMHLLDCHLFNESTPSDYKEKLEAYQKEAMNNPVSRQKLQQFIESCTANYAEYVNKLRKLWMEYDQKIQEIDDMIDSVEPDKLVETVYELIGSDANKDELGIKDMSIDEIREILISQIDLYDSNEMFLRYRDTSEGSAIIHTSDIVSAMNKGITVDFGDIELALIAGHTSDYYAQDEIISYNEQIADFFALKCLNRQDYLNVLKDIYGHDWYNFMEERCNDIAMSLQNLPG